MKRDSLFLCLFLLQVTSSLSEDVAFDDLDSVVLVNIVFRHGDRTIRKPYPNDPYKNISFWPEGFGQLTNVGVEQQYRLGQYLRQRYGKLLPPNYNLKDVLVRSTDVDRTLMSAESNLAGLYPPKTPWEQGLKWQPIPVHTVPEKLDTLIAMKRHCPRYEEELKKVMNSPEIRHINEQNKDLYDFLTNHTGEEIRDPMKVQNLFSTLCVEDLKNYTLPDWTKEVFPDKMKDLLYFSFMLPAYTKEMQRLKGGPLLGEIIKSMKNKSEASLVPDRKLFIYSAHDSTVSNLLMTLGVFDAQFPSYTSAVMLQLHRSQQGNYSVTVLFRNDTSREPYHLKLPGCLFQCPLDQFIALTKPVIPENWEKECGLHTEVLSAEEADLLMTKLTVGAVVSCGIIAILLVALLVISVLYYRLKKESHHNRNQALYMEDP